MNLVDSAGWLEFFADGDNADFFAPPIEKSASLIVSTINIYEVFKRVLQQRDENAALRAIALMKQAEIVDIDLEISLLGAKLSGELKLPMADSLILATARMHKAVLWTQDSDFRKIPGVEYIEKVQSKSHKGG